MFLEIIVLSTDVMPEREVLSRDSNDIYDFWYTPYTEVSASNITILSFQFVK